MSQLKKDTKGVNDILIIKGFRSRDICFIKIIFEIVISTLIKQQYIICIKHKETGILYKDPVKMLNYFKQTHRLLKPLKLIKCLYY